MQATASIKTQLVCQNPLVDTVPNEVLQTLQHRAVGTAAPPINETLQALNKYQPGQAIAAARVKYGPDFSGSMKAVWDLCNEHIKANFRNTYDFLCTAITVMEVHMRLMEPLLKAELKDHWGDYLAIQVVVSELRIGKGLLETFLAESDKIKAA